MIGIILWLLMASADASTAPAIQDPEREARLTELSKHKEDITKYVRVAVGWHVMKHCNFLDPAQRTEFEQDVGATTQGVAALFEKVDGSKAQALRRVMSMQQQAKGYAIAKYSGCGKEANELLKTEQVEAKELKSTLRN